ncbi:MAG: DUF3119 family protein [Leptolyngbya sp. SIO4C1]|nr:DUF3119 family protein [Leptolyngbya sp. SIO4C1]
MTSSPSAANAANQAVQLTPSYRLPLGLLAIALLLGLVQLWLGLVVGIFGLFLLYQTAVIRLVFDAEALAVYRGETEIRRFPYRDWQAWTVFWQPVPILFYFREVNSIHFLPILFSPQALRAQLEQHCAQTAL